MNDSNIILSDEQNKYNTEQRTNNKEQRTVEQRTVEQRTVEQRTRRGFVHILHQQPRGVWNTVANFILTLLL